MLMESVKVRYLGKFTKFVFTDKIGIESIFGELVAFDPQVFFNLFFNPNPNLLLPYLF